MYHIFFVAMKVIALISLSCVFFLAHQAQAQYLMNHPADIWRVHELENIIWKNRQEANRILTPSFSDQLFGDGVSGMATRHQYASPQFGNIINAQNEIDAIHRRNQHIDWSAPTPWPFLWTTPFNDWLTKYILLLGTVAFVTSMTAPFWGQIDGDTIKLKGLLKDAYGCNVVSLNPFINFGLEGHVYKR